MRRPGVEPGTSAWKAPMLTVTPSTLVRLRCLSAKSLRGVLLTSNDTKRELLYYHQLIG